ncbi:MAG TPA: hypothetical protein VHC90_14275 [Bryobacteraceae bacterium]|nr:hypothetical protein [Bryobacteraceae bacterium]
MMKPVTMKFIAAALLAVVSLQAQVKVEKTNWHGWPDAIILKNHVAAVVIVPSIGRVMNFSFLDNAHQPTEGPFWNNRMLDGKPVRPDSPQWANFGGDKTWPELQAEWPVIQKRGWPPPAGFDAASDSVQIDGSEITLVTPVDASYGIRAIRIIRLDHNRPVMTIITSFEKVQGDPVKSGIWTITQLTSPEAVYADSPAKSVFENGYINLGRGPASDITREGDRVRMRRDTNRPTKIGTDGEWLLWTGTDGEGRKINLKIERIASNPAEGEWPDKGSRLNVYTNPDRGGQPYVELEIMGPMQIMKVGDAATCSSRYTLSRELSK